jgi:hypothetical protein
MTTGSTYCCLPLPVLSATAAAGAVCHRRCRMTNIFADCATHAEYGHNRIGIWDGCGRARTYRGDRRCRLFCARTYRGRRMLIVRCAGTG